MGLFILRARAPGFHTRGAGRDRCGGLNLKIRLCTSGWFAFLHFTTPFTVNPSDPVTRSRSAVFTLARLKLLGPTPCSSEPLLFLCPLPRLLSPPSAGAAFKPKGSDYRQICREKGNCQVQSKVRLCLTLFTISSVSSTSIFSSYFI